MAKVIKPSVSPEQIGQRPKKKSPTDDFSGALAVQAGKTFGNQPARTASAEGQTNKTAILAAVEGHGRRALPSTSSVVPSPGPAAGDTAVRPASVRREASISPDGGLPSGPSARTGASAVSPRREAPLELRRDLLSRISSEPQARTQKSPDGLTRETQARPEVRSESRLEAAAPKGPASLIPLPHSGPAPIPAASAPAVPAPQLVRAQSGTPLTQIAQLIVSRAPEAGQVKAEITLYPEHLGTVQVQLSVDPSGALSAVVSASQAAVMQLGGSIADLQAALQSSGLDLAELDLHSFPEDSPRQRRQFDEGADRSAVQLAEVQPENHHPAAMIDGGSYLDVAL